MPSLRDRAYGATASTRMCVYNCWRILWHNVIANHASIYGAAPHQFRRYPITRTLWRIGTFKDTSIASAETVRPMEPLNVAMVQTFHPSACTWLYFLFWNCVIMKWHNACLWKWSGYSDRLHAHVCIHSCDRARPLEATDVHMWMWDDISMW